MNELTKRGYACPYCDSWYDTYSKASCCTEECADVKSPIPRIEVFYECSCCNKEHTYESDARDCEEEHEIEPEVDLMKVAMHPSQTKMHDY